MDVVIVGNGAAGMEAALTVRGREPDWRITLVSEESDQFFSRTALMYVLSGQLSYRDIEPLERDVYARLRLERVRARGTGLEVGERRLVLADGRRLPYDRLLIATGSRPRRPDWDGLDLPGVGHFVTLQDLEWLEREVHGGPGTDRAPNPDAHLVGPGPGDGPYRRRPVGAELRKRRPDRPVVIGGGLVGIEVVETLLAAGKKPTFLLREDAFWPISLDGAEGDFVARALRAHGVTVLTHTAVQRLEPDAHGAVGRVVADTGSFEADLVVVAVGVVPNTDWVGDAVGRDGVGGIVVDEGLKTSATGVFAAGDCASVRWFDGRVRPEQLWYTARDQGRVAGRALLGDDVRYARGTFYNSAKLMDIEYTTAGQLVGASWWFEEKGPVCSTTRIAHRDGVVTGFNFLGRRWDHSVCTRWIEERRPLPWVLAHLNEARFDTELVPPLRHARE